MTNTLMAADGRAVGKCGQRTRRALLDSFAAQLDASGFRDLSVINVARSAKTSPASFYQYFSGVEDALHVLAEEVAETAAAHPALTGTAPAWGGLDLSPATDLVEAFFCLYADHRPVLLAVDAKAAEGDKRFVAVRNRFLEGLRAQLTHAIAHGRPGSSEPERAATAELLVAMLAAMAAQDRHVATWPAGAVPVRVFAARTVHEVVTTTIAA